MTTADPAGGAKPRRQRRASGELTAAILAAARAEFDARGPSGATTAAIARRAGVTEAQLFRYFPTKADLFREAVFGALNAHFAEFQAAHQPNPGKDRSTGAEYIAQLMAFLRANRQLMVALLASQAFAGGEDSGPIDALSAYFEAGAAIRTSRFGAGDHHLAVRVSFAAALGAVVFNEWLFPPGIASQEDINSAYTTFILNGLGQ
ncbi:TetR/AcrR family transcriptional regulator [Novosphingobium sp.]|uniref:TetR/AcrR family transcriptional regulator n=1 Tax=Novosphingobium sp. TaxID=1874826 RepID=UPI0026188BF4|nr:TetR/AcrR family transcriptional regulator [Novosphingobium sp.]